MCPTNGLTGVTFIPVRLPAKNDHKQGNAEISDFNKKEFNLQTGEFQIKAYSKYEYYFISPAIQSKP